MSNRAWVTLATNDSYGLGALVLAHSLRRAGSTYPSVVLITPSVTDAMRERLRAVFAEVVIVDVLDSKDAAHLALLQRPELGITFTKIHCWNLTQYEKCVFLDADTLIVQNCDELFEREELSAAPDVGWPDCFNSGVFVFKPSAETFDSLVKFAQERGSFDGGDQGLLNSYFSDWAHGDINKHLPFLYNVTSAAFYSYIPALKHYGENLKIIHFIGAAKPWLQQFNWETRTAEAPQHLREFLQLWWDIFVGHVHSQLDISMVEVEEGLPAVSPPEPFFDVEPGLDYPHYEPTLDPESEFPWHHPVAQIPDAEINVPEINMTQFHDPWDIYRGHIPPNIDDSSSRHTETHNSEKHDEIRKYAWDYMSPQQYHTEINSLEQHSVWQQDYSQPQFEHVDHSHLDFRGNVWDNNSQYNYNEDHQSSHDFFQHTSNYESRQQGNTTQCTPDNDQKEDHHQYEHHYNPDYQQEDHNQYHLEQSKQQREIDVNFNDLSSFEKHSTSHSCNDHNHKFSFEKHLEKSNSPVQNQHRIEHVYYVHLDHERERINKESNKTELESEMNGDGESDSEYFEDIRPRHPYDGFYLRHRITIDSRGRKICTHEVPPTPTPSPPESPTPEDFQHSEAGEEITQSNGTEDQTGVAGNLARVVLGASAQREALDDLTRRQGWEAGNIDYMGADAFDNIWAKISQTLSQPRTSPPKQSSPPPATAPAPVEAARPVEEKPAETPAPVEAPAPQATTVVDTPAPAIPLEASVPPEAPAEKPEAAKTETPVQAAKPPESLAPLEAPAAVPEPAKPAEPAVEVSASAPAVAEAPAAPEPAKTVAAAAPTEEPKVATPAEIPATPVIPVEAPAAPVKAPAVPVEAPAAQVAAPAVPVEAPATPSESTVKVQAPKAAAVAPKAVSPPQSPAAVAPSKPKAPKPEVTPEKGASPTDSPPLANTPSKEEVPIVPAAKSEERRKPAEKLQLPAAAADALPTPDSKLEDAAALAHAIIASELRTPTVTSPSPGADPASPASPLDQRRLSADEQVPPTPPAGVSLAQIGVKPKPTIAAQIESSVTEAADPPKKKVVKKVLKKEAASGEAPVPPPRKKEKKPKDK